MTLEETSERKNGGEEKRRVCVIGGGASGLMAALELTKANYDVTVIEKNPKVAGKCASISVDGFAYDLGGHLCNGSCENIEKLLEEFGVESEPTLGGLIFDVEEKKVENPDLAGILKGYEKYLHERESFSGKFLKPSISFVSEYSQSAIDWLKEKQLDGVFKTEVGTKYTASGYGYIDSKDLPIAYLLKFLEMLHSNDGKFTLKQPFWTVKGGYARIWEAVADKLEKVLVNTTVEKIERKENVRVYLKDGEVKEFDYLILACPLHLETMNKFLEFEKEEVEILSKIEFFKYFTTVCRAEGLPKQGFYHLKQHCQDSSTIGHCVAFHHRYDETNVYLMYSYGTPEMNGEHITEMIKEDISKSGGNVLEILHQEEWQYFAHFSCENFTQYTVAFEELQGKSNTFYLGSANNFELVECNLQYVKHLVSKFFLNKQEVV